MQAHPHPSTKRTAPLLDYVEQRVATLRGGSVSDEDIYANSPCCGSYAHSTHVDGTPWTPVGALERQCVSCGQLWHVPVDCHITTGYYARLYILSWFPKHGCKENS